MGKLTKDEFLRQANEIHGNRYDYTKMNFINGTTKICIICPEHGEFWQTPCNHLSGSRCPTCGKISRSKKNRITKDEFIKRAKDIHGNKYDYSKMEYIDYNTPVCIICPEHGEFWQKPKNHSNGYGCKKCGIELNASKLRSNTEEFLEKARKIHGDTYDLSKVVYEKSSTKVTVICPEHGEFLTTPNDFLDGHGCPECAKKIISDKLSTVTQEEFLNRCREIHGEKYDYSETFYKRWEQKVKILCPKHGEFWQTPHAHIDSKHGCPKCGSEKRGLQSRLTTEEFIDKSNKKHNNRYDYSKVKYVTGYDKVCIICPEHGEFWQIAQDHLSGHGCRKCQRSFLEEEIIKLLDNKHIDYIYDKPYDFLDGLKLDFYIPDKKIAIECQGEQHFRPICFGGMSPEKAKINFKEQWSRDIKKAKLCKENGIDLFYYSNKEDIYPYKVITDINKIIDIISNEQAS